MNNTSAESSVTGNTRKQYDKKNQEHFQRLENIISQAGYTLQDILEHYPAFIQRRALPRVLAHYELFKQIQNLPGCIIELGVYRGSGFFTWANLLETFCPGDRTRKVYGFDHYQGLTEHNKTKDGDLEPWLNCVLGDLKSNSDIMHELVKLHNDDNFLPGIERCQLVDGDLCETLPSFVEQHPGLRLSLLYFDVGLYEPTMAGLEHLYPLVMPGGLVVFNGYGMQPWEGESSAIEKYFADKKMGRLNKFEFSPIPHAYFIKE